MSGTHHREERQRLLPWLINEINKGDIPGLLWLDKEQHTVRIPWTHGSRHGFSGERDSLLFKRWAAHTGRYKDNQTPKKWKANFRCALHSLNSVGEVKAMSIKRGQQACRVYRISTASHDRACPGRMPEHRQSHRKQTAGSKLSVTSFGSSTSSASASVHHQSASALLGKEDASCSQSRNSARYPHMNSQTTASESYLDPSPIPANTLHSNATALMTTTDGSTCYSPRTTSQPMSPGCDAGYGTTGYPFSYSSKQTSVFDCNTARGTKFYHSPYSLEETVVSYCNAEHGQTMSYNSSNAVSKTMSYDWNVEHEKTTLYHSSNAVSKIISSDCNAADSDLRMPSLAELMFWIPPTTGGGDPDHCDMTGAV